MGAVDKTTETQALLVLKKQNFFDILSLKLLNCASRLAQLGGVAC
jgi:hypothetical protein